MGWIKRILVYLGIGSAIIALLVTTQVLFSMYQDYQAKEFVASIRGEQNDPPRFYHNPERDVHAKLYIKWNFTTNKYPRCNVTIDSRLRHTDTGFSLPDSTSGVISRAEFDNIHISKNGQLTFEPIYNQALAEEIEERGGHWTYELSFTFHCSKIDNEWLNVFKDYLDNTYLAAPVLITID